jgi:sporulation protein YlmC with PRC-barrel domain
MVMIDDRGATLRAEPGAEVGLVHLAGSGLDLAVAADDVRGMVVVDPDGHRLGEVRDLVVDTGERRARLLAVVSGGVLGLDTTERLVPVEVVAKVDDRVRVARSCAEITALPSGGPAPADPVSFAAVYGDYGLTPFGDGRPSYFHAR